MHLSFRTTQDTPHAKSSRPNPPPSDKRLLMTMRTFGRRALALLASCALVASMTPVAAFAGGSEGDAQQQSTGVQQSTTAASDAGKAADANASVTARANVASSSDDEGSWGDDDDDYWDDDGSGDDDDSGDTSGSGTTGSSSSTPAASATADAIDTVKIEPTSGPHNVGDTLKAHAYKAGASHYQTGEEITDGVTFTWRYSSTDPTGRTITWNDIVDATGKPVTGSTYTVTDDMAGKWIAFTAKNAAGEKKLGEWSAVGPFKKAGIYDLYSAVLKVNGVSGYDASVGDTLSVEAKDTDKQLVPSDKLTYKWEYGDPKSGDFTPIDGATSATYTIADEYAGKYIRCTVNGGADDKSSRATNAVARGGSVKVNSVSVAMDGSVVTSSTKAMPGAALTATALDSNGKDISDKVSWAWYASTADYASGVSEEDAIADATSPSFTVPQDASYLGKHLYVSADGGYGKTTQAAGVVGIAGAVDLYDVTVSSGANVLHVGDTLHATVTKKGSSSWDHPAVDATDTVSYQWQYATSSTTADASFTDIAGATSPTYEVPSTLADGTSLVGAYLRVKATSNNTVVSTSKPSYYGTESVNPVGPVMRPGQYTLSLVSISSSKQGMQVGALLTPTAKVSKSAYSEQDAPGDADLSYTWYKAADGTDAYEQITSGYDSKTGKLALTKDLIGYQLKVEASALDNTVSELAGTVVGADEYNLLRVTVTPASGSLFTGDSLSATVQAKRLGDSTIGDDVTDKVSLQWYTAPTADADESTWTSIPGATTATLEVPSGAAGSYLMVKATSGSSSVSKSDGRKVIAADSLQAAALKLADWRFTPKFGSDTNANECAEAYLAQLGFSGIKVKTTSASLKGAAGRTGTTGGIETGDANNGAITYFFDDPSTKTGYTSYSTLRQLDVTFELERDGATQTATLSHVPQLPWDLDKVDALLAGMQDKVSVGYASGDDKDSVTQNLTLPYQVKVGSGYYATTFPVTWTSSNEAVTVSGYGWDDYSGKVARSAADTPVTLTARISAKNLDSSDDSLQSRSCDVAFPLTVKGDPEKVAQEREKLATELDAAFTKEKLSYSSSGAPVGDGALTDDVQLPRTRDLGIDGKYYKVTYAASNDSAVINGYRANIYRPAVGAQEGSTDITCTITSKDTPEITASKTLSFAIEPLDKADIDREAALMDAAVAGYWNGISNGQDSTDVTGSLHAFQKATLGADGSVVWSYDSSSASAAGDGIVPATIPGADDMGVLGWNRFRSSKPDIIKHENLVFQGKPEFNTKVTVDSYLRSEKYGRYAERYPDDATFKKLAGTAVSATFTVMGTTGKDAPTVTATASLVGIDTTGAPETWSSVRSYSLAPGSTAADVTEELLTASGLSADYANDAQGFVLNSVTSPNGGRTLGADALTGKRWQLFVNGEASDRSADQVTLEQGDSIEWAYVADGESAPSATLEVSCAIYGPDASGTSAAWAPQTTISVAQGSTAADVTKALISKSGLNADYTDTAYGFYLSSITSPFDGSKLGWDESTGKFWQLFVNGKAANKMADQIVLKAGDAVSWSYSKDGEGVPSVDPVVDPATDLPDYQAQWPQFGMGKKDGAVVTSQDGTLTPTDAASAVWTFDPLSAGSTGSMATEGVSDPLIVNGDVYLIAGSKIYKVDTETGKEKLSKPTGLSPAFYFCRPVYANGMIFAAANDGRIAAFNANTLDLVWCTDALPKNEAGQYQSLSSLSIVGDRLIACFTVVGAANVSKAGTMVCVDATPQRSGSSKQPVWTTTETAGEGESSGYYWAAGAPSGGDLLIADDTGNVKLIDSETGAVKAQLPIGTPSHSGVVALSDVDDSGNGTYLAVSRDDGTLHKVCRQQDSLSETGSVSFATTSTSTPAVYDGKAYVCGMDADGYGTLSVVDLSTMTVLKTVRGGKGAAQSSPLVSAQADGVYAYFTCNNETGGVYAYKLGDDQAYQIFTPDADNQNYCTASLISDASGNLYYANDARKLMKLNAQPGATLSFDTRGGESLAPVKVARGHVLSSVPQPTRAGYTFGGWYLDEACSQPWDASGPVEGPLTLYAKWSADPQNGVAEKDGNASTGGASPMSISGSGSAAEMFISQAAQESAGQDSQATGAVASAQPAADSKKAADDSKQGGLPIWPLIGMAAAAAVLVLAALYYLKSRKEH